MDDDILLFLNLGLTKTLFVTQMMFFTRKLSTILDERQECRGRYELVLIPKNGSHKIADILVKMQPAAEVVVDLEASWHNQ